LKSTKTAILAIFTAFLLLTFTACSNSDASDNPDKYHNTSSLQNDNLTGTMPEEEQTPENNEYGIKFFVVPEMSDEQQTFYTDYVEKLLYSGMLLYDWSGADYSSISKEAGGASNASDLMLAFEDIIGMDKMQKLFEQYDGDFPADVVKEVLPKYFPFTIDDLHEILSYHYNAETNIYHYEGGRGGGPIAAAVVNIRPEINGPLHLDYEVYSGYSGLDYTPDSYQYKRPGVLTLAPDLEGGYKYLLVEVGEEIEAPKLSGNEPSGKTAEPSSHEDAKKLLSAYLTDHYSFVEGSDYLVDGHESRVFDTDCFTFDWRYGPQYEGIHYRLQGNYAISADGNKFFYYDRGEDAWFELINKQR
jgi:hypothetical protein